MLKQTGKARHCALVLGLALLGGCERGDFEVDITIKPGTLSAATIASVDTLEFVVSGEDDFTQSIPTPMPFAKGEERVRFFAARGKVGMATIQVTGFAGGSPVARGTQTVILKEHGVVALTIELSDYRVDSDGGVADLGGGVDLSPSDDLSVQTGVDLAEAATLAFDRPLFHFGTLNVGATSAAAFLVVTNNGSVESGMLGPGVSGSPSITVDSDLCSTKRLMPGATCLVSAKFHPLVAGPATTFISWGATPGGTAQIMLAGSAEDVGALSVTPTSEVFASTEVGAVSSPTTFTVTNTGTETALILATQATGTDAPHFDVGVDTCTGTALTMGATCIFQAQFQPSSAGRKTAAIAIVASPGGTVSAPVSGEAVLPAKLTITPDAQSCGAVALGDTGSVVTFTVGNSGMGPSGTLTAQLTGGDASEFVLDNTGCVAALAPGDECTLTVKLAPLVQGDKTATLEVSGKPGGVVSAMVTGKGTTDAQLVLASSGPTAYPDTTIGDTSASLEFEVVNNGGANTGTLTTSLTDATNFTFVTNDCVGKSLAAMERCRVTVAFKPTAPAAAKSTALMITGAPGGSVSVPLTAKAISPAVFSISATTNTFPDTVVNTDSADATFTLTNDGDAQSGVISVMLTNATEFVDASTTSKCDGARLDHLGTCVVKVHFHPTSVASGKMSTLTVMASPGGTKTVMMSGAGVTAGTLAIAPTGKDFGEVVVNQTSVEQLFTVINNGGSTTSALVTTFTGEFDVTTGQNNCESATLISGGMCTLKATFKPTTIGSKVGTLKLTAGAASTTASLAGVGMSTPTLSVNPTTFDFGTVDVGATTAAKSFVVSNTGSSAGAITVTPSGSTSDFQVVNSCTSLAGGGDNCTISVSCSPQSQGAKSLTLGISGADGGSTSATPITCQGNSPTLLTVAIGGPGASYGKVVSTVPDSAINCPGTCSKSYAASTNVTLQASVPIAAAATFTGWSVAGGGSCAGTGTCTVALGVAKTVTANFSLKQYTLTVTKDVKASATGVISGGPITCGATCSALVDYGTSINLNVAPDAGFGFGGWTNACTGMNPCSVLMTSDRTTTAALSPFNKMFVTTTNYNGNLGGLSGGDAKCQARATAVGLSGTYLAWLSTNTVNARDRLIVPGSGGTPARGWTRVDGTAFTDRLTDLLASPALIYYPPLLPEDGVRPASATQLPWTGTLSDGTKSTNRCSDWTSASSSLQGNVGGVPRMGAPKWTAYGDSNCDLSRQLYCFGVDYAVALPPPTPPAVHRKAFVSTAIFAATGGRAAADAICQSEGTTAFGSGKTFMSLLATTTDAPGSRFSGTVPWVSTSGAVVANDATKLNEPHFESGPNRTAQNTILNTAFWSGATAINVAGTTASTCNNWSSTSGSGSSGDNSTVGGFIASATTPCGQSLPVVCLEQ